MHKIAVLGDEDSVNGFEALGINVFSIKNANEARDTLKAIKDEYSVIFVTEEFGEAIMEDIKELNRSTVPVITIIPGIKGITGLGMEILKKTVEKAVGTDILHKKG